MMGPEEGVMQSRAQAMSALLELITDQPLIICNGFPSREVHKLRDRDANFYMIGSMGVAPAIGLGVALSKPIRRWLYSTATETCSWAWGLFQRWVR